MSTHPSNFVPCFLQQQMPFLYFLYYLQKKKREREKIYTTMLYYFYSLAIWIPTPFPPSPFYETETKKLRQT